MKQDPAAEPTPRARWAALAILSLFLIHAIAGFVSSIPAWHMFMDADRYEYTLTDAQGRAVDLRDHVHDAAYITDHTLVPRIAYWIADTQPERAPLRGTVTLHHPDATLVKEFVARPGERAEWSRIVEDPTGKSSSSNKESGS